MKLLKFAGLILGLLIGITVKAEPLNVLVGDLTFTRPNSWKFAEPDPNSPAVCRFIIPGPANRADGEARFYRAGPEPDKAARMWEKYLVRNGSEKVRQETKTIGARTITYVFLKGTLTLPGQRATDDQGFIGVVIPYGTKFVHIRFSGPQKTVEDATTELKKMIETAVREKEDEAEPSKS